MQDRFSNLPPTASQRLALFRSTNMVRSYETRGVLWSYTSGGKQDSSDPVLLMLPGGEYLAEAGFEWLLAFQQSFRVISPSYPTGLGTVSDLTEGIIRLMDRERLTWVNVIGTSLGGMLAQSLVRACPNRVNALVLSQTPAPYPPYGTKLQKRLGLFKRLPAGVIRWILLTSLDRSVKKEPEAEFWKSFLRELYANPPDFAKDILKSSYSAIVDFNLNARYTSADLTGWPGRMLITQAGEDRSLPPEGRTLLNGLYPTAKKYTFSQADHSLGSKNREIYVSMVTDFLSGNSRG